MATIKRTARVINTAHRPDAAAEDLSFARKLVRDVYRRTHGGAFPRLGNVGHVFEPEP